MPYTIEQWNDHMQKVIGAMNDQATLTSLVTQASDEYTGLFATNTTLSTENEQLKQENTRLKEANLELFLRVGQQNLDKTGKIIAVKKDAGAAVKKGEVILVLEAMKMENEIVAPQDGTVASVNVGAGDAVEAGDVLATMN